jgi:LmbE family N-acetylglucosaminyl deacetylase
LLVAVTDGEAAFGATECRPRRALARRRAAERHAALDELGVLGATEVVRLGVPDGAVHQHEVALARQLVDLVAPLVISTWRHDGHPDHEATGRAVAAAARDRGARHLEFPVWAPHRERWTSSVASQARRVPLSQATRSAKLRAVAAFTSQLAPSPDGRPVVSADLIARLRRDDEYLIGPSARG